MGFGLESVSLRFRGPPPVTALDHVTLSIERGERVALMGASGSGKSSLLRILAGLETPCEGRVTRDGTDIAMLGPAERGVGMVLQDAPLYEHMTLVDNVAQPLRARGEGSAEARRRASEMLERVALSGRAAARGGEISGGERRRVALARALVTRPALLLLDEPFASLEPRLRLELRDLVRDLCVEFDCACVHATHDGLEALALGTRLIVLDAGRVVDDGPPGRVWRSPACAASASLVGSVPMNIVPADMASHPGDGAPQIAIRAERLRLEPAPPSALAWSAPHASRPVTAMERPSTEDALTCAWSARGVVRAVESMGDRWLVTVALDGADTRLRAIVQESASIAPGTPVLALADAESIVLLPDTTSEQP